jgi:hypothetical protein
MRFSLSARDGRPDSLPSPHHKHPSISLEVVLEPPTPSPGLGTTFEGDVVCIGRSQLTAKDLSCRMIIRISQASLDSLVLRVIDESLSGMKDAIVVNILYITLLEVEGDMVFLCEEM